MELLWLLKLCTSPNVYSKTKQVVTVIYRVFRLIKDSKTFDKNYIY